MKQIQAIQQVSAKSPFPHRSLEGPVRCADRANVDCVHVYVHIHVLCERDGFFVQGGAVSERRIREGECQNEMAIVSSVRDLPGPLSG